MAPRPSLPPSHKKRKLNSEKNADDVLVSSIQTLEAQLTAAVSNKTTLNPLADLLDIAQNATEPSVLSKAIYALYRVFVVIIAAGMLSGPAGDDTAKAVRSWINERLQSYAQLLVGLLKDEEKALKTSALTILMSLQKHLSTAVSKTSSTGPQWHNAHFKQAVQGLLTCPSSPRSHQRTKKRKSEEGENTDSGTLDSDVRDLFVDKWLTENDDVRWFFLRESASVLASFDKSSNPHAPANLLSFLERLSTFPTDSSELNSWWVEELGARPPKPKAAAGDDDEEPGSADPADAADDDAEDDWRKFFEEEAPATEQKKTHVRIHKLTIHQSLHSLAAHRAIFTRTWLALLPHLSVGSEESRRALATRALNVMHRGVMPHLTRAVLVMDWVGSCVDYGGSVGLLSLNALFILMKEYNLDYPSFYTRLYTFLDRDVLHLKHRARFFRMTELFLSSTHLPATLLASFVKRLARLSLSAPPAAIVMIIPFTYNILKRHPSLMAMIHRDDEGPDQDAFDFAEPNPTTTRAIDSSLWELYTHRQHYHSAVSTLAKIFSEAFTKPNYALEDFLDHTYNTLFDTEVKRRIKKEPVLALEPAHHTWFQNAESETAQIDKVEELCLKPAWLQSATSPVGASRAVEDDEADLAAPSWSTGADIRWNEPSDDSDSHGFGWSHTEPDLAWGGSTYDDIQIGKATPTVEVPPSSKVDDVEPVAPSPPSAATLSASEPEVEEEEEPPPDDPEPSPAYQTLDEAEPDAPPSPVERTPSPPTIALPDSPSHKPAPITVPSRSPSPDGFGVFSSGFEAPEEESSDFKRIETATLEDDAWGSAWANAEEESAVEEEAEDEWTAAQRRKQDFDQRIPPEFVEDIKKRCEALCDMITPKGASDRLDTDDDSFRNNLRMTMDDLEEMPTIKDEYLPELTLQPPLNFPKTATFKGMTSALKLTRNLPMVRGSPMSHYMASKGSTAWEKSVRGRKDVVEEDPVPVGWRILEKEAPRPAAAPAPKSGGLFSFWGRKESKPVNTPPASVTPVSASAAESSKTSSLERVRSSSDRRASSESARSMSSTRTTDVTSPSSMVPVAGSSPFSPGASSSLPTTPASEGSYADAPMADLDGTEAPPQAAPTAVSRFLNRFSRRKSSIASSTSSPRQSLAMSSDDLEFLSDIVPSVSEGSVDDTKAFAAVLTPEALPPLLAPPPLTTPTSSKSVLTPSLTSASKLLPPQPQSARPVTDDLYSLFDGIESPTSNASGSFPLLGMATSPVQPSPSVASSSRPQSPAVVGLLSPAKPITPSPLSVGAASQAASFGLPPPPAPRVQTPILAPPERQLFAFPPPPSLTSSRSQTPRSLSPPSRPQSGLSQMNRTGSVTASNGRAKVSLPHIGIPPHPSGTPLNNASPALDSPDSGGNSRPITPTSSVPLAVLYPNAVHSNRSSTPSLGLPPPPALPPPSNRSQSLQPILPPPLHASKPPPPSVMTSFDDDDDDFDDFQSSSHQVSHQPMPLTPDSSIISPGYQSPASATHAPMLASSRPPPKPATFGASLAAQKEAANSFFKSAVAAASKPAPLSFDSFDDEFSAFAASSTPMDSSRSRTFDTSGSSLLPADASASSSGFDASNSFSSDAALRTPSPPKPPAKNPPPVAMMSTDASPKKRADSNARPSLSIAPPPPPSASRATRHLHTLSLMELANSEKGKKWLAPPSPLPQPLVPPPGAQGQTHAGGFDFMAEDDSFGSFNSTTMADGFTASNSSPATFGHQPLLSSSSTSSSNGIGLPPPPSGFAKSQSTSSAGSGQWLMGSGSDLSSSSGGLQSIGNSAASKGGKSGGGLSAQDLSFFEGL
ncbi:hypothetical protein EIP91_012222 [Steccherinum ochraceum]|uniref:CCAAT-binding factor domain-containing protein n=1 Tax=Steccherinum ochraceum TaxID=92696 RepID=A0A4R0RKD0_9APHY|nr:hypothetical protein EIP91_012222 [Steccherinum ochraceum]